MESTEQLHTDGIAKKTANMESNTELIEQCEIKGTPFTALRHDKHWYLTMGKYRLTEEMNSKEEVIENAQDASWFRIIQIVGVVVEEFIKEKKIIEDIEELKEKKGA